jgi:hypothetical protein
VGKKFGKVQITDRKFFRGDVAHIFGKNAASVTVGVFGSAGEEPHDAKTEGAAGGLTCRDLAEIHEFGLGNVPARSFVRAYFDANRERLRDMLGVLMRKAIERVIKSGAPIDDSIRTSILTKLGIKMQTEMQARIARGIEPPLDPRTVMRKGSSTPLIDTGQLRSSITFVVDLGGKLPARAPIGEG